MLGSLWKKPRVVESPPALCSRPLANAVLETLMIEISDSVAALISYNILRTNTSVGGNFNHNVLKHVFFNFLPNWETSF